MSGKSVVVVTGVSGYWGTRVAARLLAQGDRHVIGLDVQPPGVELKGLDFVHADLRNPLLGELLESEHVEQVCHLSFQHSITPSQASYERNVVGTQELLAACLQAGVRHVVYKSSTAVYGARQTNAAFLTEEHPLRGSPKHGLTRDLVEVENLFRDLCRRAPNLQVTILRFASIVGPTAITPMTSFLAESRAPTLLGFDPIMQLIHERDVEEALVHAVHSGTAGVFNVAAPDLMPLNRVRALARKPARPVYHRWVYRGARMLRGREAFLQRYLPVDPDALRYRMVGDLTKMGAELGFQPRYTAEQALREFAQRRRGARDPLATLGQDEEWLRSVLERRRLSQTQRGTEDVGEGEGR